MTWSDKVRPHLQPLIDPFDPLKVDAWLRRVVDIADVLCAFPASDAARAITGGALSVQAIYTRA